MRTSAVDVDLKSTSAAAKHLIFSSVSLALCVCLTLCDIHFKKFVLSFKNFETGQNDLTLDFLLFLFLSLEFFIAAQSAAIFNDST